MCPAHGRSVGRCCARCRSMYNDLPTLIIYTFDNSTRDVYIQLEKSILQPGERSLTKIENRVARMVLHFKLKFQV